MLLIFLVADSHGLLLVQLIIHFIKYYCYYYYGYYIYYYYYYYNYYFCYYFHYLKSISIPILIAYRSKAESGIQIPVPMSGEIGPGAYPGTEIPAIQIKSPKKISPPFIKTNNLHDVRFLNSNLNTLRPRFNVTHNVIADKQYSLNANSNSNLNKIPFQKPGGVLFSTDKIFDGNVYKQKIAKRKIKKIYPKLAEKFSDLEYNV